MSWILKIIIYSLTAYGADGGELIGRWQAIGYYYQDQFIEPTDKNFKLIYEFRLDGTDTLSWHREGESGFCERRGQWYVVNGILHDEVTWVHPENMMGCSGDPDMELGRKTEAPFEIRDQKLHTVIPLGSEELIYVWQFVSSS